MAGEDKKPIMSWESLIKLGMYIVLGTLAYANMSAKVEATQTTSNRIESSLAKEQDKWDIQRSEMNLRIQTCQTQIAVLNEQIKDLKHD
jgi:hypothetical protein